MFRITEDPSSGSFVQYLAKITRMVLLCPLTWTSSVFMAAYCKPMCLCVCVCVCECVCVCVCVCSSVSRKSFQTLNSTQTQTHTQTHWFTICCHNTDHVHVNGHDRTILVILAKHCKKPPDDGSSVIRNMSEYF